MGNQADLTVADFMEYLVGDPDTGAIIIYLEGVTDGRRFREVAREAVRRKPVLVYKSGRTAAGARAARSHTASLAGQDALFDALCQQTGVIRTAEVIHAFEIAEALIHLPPAPGKRVAIIGTGGQGVVTSDSCAALGLQVPELDEATKLRLKKVLSPHAPPPANPIDFAGSTRTAMEEARVAEELLALPYIDALIMNQPGRSFLSSTSISQARDTLDAIELLISLPKRYHKPVVLQRFPQVEGDVVVGILRRAGIPSYDTPEEAARAVWALARYAEVRGD